MASMADTERGGIHVVLLPYPSQGHINPILQFGKRLTGHGGVRCTLAVTRFILRQGEPSTGAVHVAAYSDGYDAGGFHEARNADEYLSRLESHGSDTVDRLLRSEAEQGRPVHALVYDSFLSWAPRVAARHGAASAAFFTQACAVNVAYENVFAGRVKLPLAAGEEPLQLPGISVGLTLDDVPTFMADTKDSPAYLDLLVNQFKGLDMADHVLVNSFYELQPQEAEHMASAWRAKTVGPTVPSAYLDNRLPDDTSYGFHLFSPATETTAWLDVRPTRSVAYVSFGSVATPSPAQMAEVAEGLYRTGKPFLWVVRASEISKIPKGFAVKAAAEERGLIVTWCPQLEVLALRSHVPGTLGTRDGNEERDTTVQKLGNEGGYRAYLRLFEGWNAFQADMGRSGGTMSLERATQRPVPLLVTVTLQHSGPCLWRDGGCGCGGGKARSARTAVAAPKDGGCSKALGRRLPRTAAASRRLDGGYGNALGWRPRQGARDGGCAAVYASMATEGSTPPAST